VENFNQEKTIMILNYCAYLLSTNMSVVCDICSADNCIKLKTVDGKFLRWTGLFLNIFHPLSTTKCLRAVLIDWTMF